VECRLWHSVRLPLAGQWQHWQHARANHLIIDSGATVRVESLDMRVWTGVHEQITCSVGTAWHGTASGSPTRHHGATHPWHAHHITTHKRKPTPPTCSAHARTHARTTQINPPTGTHPVTNRTRHTRACTHTHWRVHATNKKPPTATTWALQLHTSLQLQLHTSLLRAVRRKLLQHRRMAPHPPRGQVLRRTAGCVTCTRVGAGS